MKSGNAEALEDLINKASEDARRLAHGCGQAEPLTSAAFAPRAAPTATTRFLDLPLRPGRRHVRRPAGGKSISNRALLLAGLSAGTTEVHDLLDSDDTQVMLARAANSSAAASSARAA